MKKLGFFGKIVFFLNSILAVGLLLGYLLPYFPPRILPVLSILSLFLPVLLILNGLFLLYWLLQGRRQFLLSGFVLALGIFHILSLFRFGGASDNKKTDLTVLSFNVRHFNSTKWMDKENVGDDILAFVYRENPNVVCFQEYNPNFSLDPEVYPHILKNETKTKTKTGQILYSKFPIINSGSLDFEDTYNGGIYADILVKNDTVRVYNIHFQSLRISSNFGELQKEKTKSLLARMGQAFKMQQDQLAKFLQSESTSPHPVIVAGDFNNSATSYLYRKVKGEKNDAFAKAGSGTGATYTFDFVPLRIDFILSDPELEITDFKTYDLMLSDHQPIKSSFKVD